MRALYKMHEESLQFMLDQIIQLASQLTKKELYDKIKEIDSYDFIKIAKRFFENEYLKEEIYDDLAFMSSDYSPQEYYKFFSKRIVLENKKGLSSIIKKVGSHIIHR